MNASLLAVLNDTERLLVAETERASLAALDEDAAIELESRIRRARNKYVGQYRRAASAAIAGHGGRGKARPENTTARMKAEAFEEALSRVSRRVATLARQAAQQLRGAAGRGTGREAERRARSGNGGRLRGPERTHRHRGAGWCPAAADTGEREAAGRHPRHGCPPAGQEGQPVSQPPPGGR